MNNFDGVNFANFKFPMVVVFKEPLDFKNDYVARVFDLDSPTSLHVIGKTLEEVRESIPQWMHRMNRHENDEPHILEVWL